MRRFTIAILGMTAVLAASTPAAAGVASGKGGFVGFEAGMSKGVDVYDDFTDTGATFGPFGGYMLCPGFGFQANLQGTWNNTTGEPSDQNTWILGGLGGFRAALPFEYGELFGVGQAGFFTGLVSGSAVTDSSVGFSGGGGINFDINENWMIGGIGRYYRLYQRVHGLGDVEFVTGGIALTYRFKDAAEPPVAAAEVAPAAPPAVPDKKKIVLRGVNFDFDKANIRSDAKPVLDEAVSTLKEHGTVTIVTEGHTDAVGTDDYNQKLSLRRAGAVRDYLVQGGISSERIKIEGHGESKPVATNDTADGRAQNRRVELRVSE